MGLLNNIFKKNEADLFSKIRAWIETIEKQETLPDEITAICIGLFEGESTYQIYFIASKEYDEDDDDWACNQDFEPNAKYLDSGIPSSRGWEEFQDEVIQSVKRIMDSKLSRFLQQVDHVSAGFDSGELEHIK